MISFIDGLSDFVVPQVRDGRVDSVVVEWQLPNLHASPLVAFHIEVANATGQWMAAYSTDSVTVSHPCHERS